MKHSITNQFHEITTAKKRKINTIIIWSVLSVIVASGVFWQLRLSGATMEKETYCGKVEHQHSEECVASHTLICGFPEDPEQSGKVFACPLEPHTHSPACYTGDVLTCGYADYVIHSHNEYCYETGTLVCTLPEVKEHTHASACYDDKTNWLCGLTETDIVSSHTHDEACYTQTQELICPLAEDETHSHGETCWKPVSTLSCALPEQEMHKHSESCGCEQSHVLVCDLPEVAEHIHDASCYGENGALICGKLETHVHVHTERCWSTNQDAGQHVHTDDCYAVEYSCGLEEHEHTLLCYSNPNADVESREQWEATLPQADKLSGIWSDDLIAVAESQLGYQESTHNYILSEDGEQIKGYTRYGAWYGDEYGDWCAMFVSFCLHYAEIPQELAPIDASVEDMRTAWEPLDRYRTTGYIPVSGDIVFFDMNGDTGSDHIGIVREVICDSTGTPTHFIAIEGNSENTVRENTYALNDERVMGYGQLPENSAQANQDEDQEVSDWAALLENIQLMGNMRTDALAIAEKQVGYTESTEDVLTDEDGSVNGYTAYGAWRGTPYADWNAIFLSFCMTHAGMPEDGLCQNADCQLWYNNLRDSGKLLAVAEYLPEPGDLVFFRQSNELRVGLVSEYTPADDEQAGSIILITGDLDNSVKKVSFSLTEVELLGYAALVSETGPVMEERMVQVSIYTDESYAQPAEDNAVITVTGRLPAGLTARAYPVEVQIEGQQILRAYDVTLFLEDGGIYEPETGSPVTVSVKLPEFESEPDLEYGVYYVPENGNAPEQVGDANVSEGEMVFTAPHFSVYALTATRGTLGTVYLNGATGNDNNAGSSSAPVATFAKALELLSENGTIIITGTVTVSDTQTWSMTDVAGANSKIIRGGSFSGELVHIASSGSLTLQNIIIDGDSQTSTTTAYAPLVVNDGALNITAGTSLQNNDNKGQLPQTQNASYPYRACGGAVYSTGSLAMSGGTVQGCAAQVGGGIYVKGASASHASFSLTGGTIQNNEAKYYVSPYGTSISNGYVYKCAGGGVMIDDYADMTMTGGTISGNTSGREGGGVSLGWTHRGPTTGYSSYISTLNMTGGTMTGNSAGMAGGGLNVAAARIATVTGGSFTNNNANGIDPINGYTTYSGGGIYIDGPWTNDSTHVSYGLAGKIILKDILVTGNFANKYSSSSGGGFASCPKGNTKVVFGSGSAFYGNTSNNAASNELHIAAHDTGSHDISEFMLGGSPYNWTISSGSLTGGSSALYADNPYVASDPEIQKIYDENLYSVLVSGNTAHLGGGIGTNGDVEIGDVPADPVDVVVQKAWTGSGTVPASITVYLLRDGVRIAAVTLKPDTNGVWQPARIDNLPRTDGNGHVYTYTVSEGHVNYYTSSVGPDTDASDDFSYVITNTPVTEPISVTVQKAWDDVGYESVRPSGIQVQLKADGAVYDTVTLNSTNSWNYTWSGLPKKNAAGNNIVYGVTELELEGYTTTIASTTSGQPAGPATWRQATQLTAGKTYRFVSSSGTALANTDAAEGCIEFINAGANDARTQWTASANGSYFTLTNVATGNPLELYSTSLWAGNDSGYQYSGFSNGRLYSYYSGYYYYLTGIYAQSNGDHFGSTSVYSSNAMSLTLYEMTSGTPSTETISHVITNTRIVEIQLKKVDADNQSTLLSGATFALYKASSATDAVTIPGASGTWETVAGAGQLVSSEENALTISGLENGVDYCLVETAAPAGFAALSEPIIFSIGTGGAISLTQTSNGMAVIGTDDQGTLIVKNNTSYELPETGGVGTLPYTILGLLLVLGSAGYACMKRHRGRTGKAS